MQPELKNVKQIKNFDINKIEILKQLNFHYPEKVEIIVKQAEKICFDNISTLNESEKEDYLLAAICNSPVLISKEIYLLLESCNFIKNIQQEQFLSELEKKVVVFSQELKSISLNIEKGNFSGLEELTIETNELAKKCTFHSLKTNNQIKILTDYLKKCSFYNKDPDFAKLLQDFTLIINNYKKETVRLNTIFSSLLLIQKKVNEMNIIFNKKNDLINHKKKLNHFKTDIEKNISEKEFFISKIENYKFSQMDENLEFFVILKNYCNILAGYPVLRTLSSKAKDEKLTSSQPEDILLKKFLRLKDSIKKTIANNNFTPDTFIKEVFIPLSDKFSNEESEAFQKLIKSLI